MAIPCKYIAHQADAQGYVNYSDIEDQTWEMLITRQLRLVKERACSEFLDGLNQLNLPLDRIPQIPDINNVLGDITGWGVTPVPALIELDHFFSLLANKRFPAATFIRRREELDYLQEPDIFHEIFGHCPMLANQAFADFSEEYGKLGLRASPLEREYMSRLYWFTVEFGLVESSQGMRIYGGGILSSKGETLYALDSAQPMRAPFDVLTALRTPYRIDIMQPLYYTLNSLDDLLAVSRRDLLALIHEAQQLGDFLPLFPPAEQCASA